MNYDQVLALYEMPFIELVFKAQTVHQQFFSPNEVQVSTLLSIKTGACPEDCTYCSQSGRYNTPIKKESLLPLDEILERAKAAKAKGASRFCMGAAWRSPPAKYIPQLKTIIQEVKALGLETCVTLGMLNEMQAAELKTAGLDYYNHNLDTSEDYYAKIVSTRTYKDRLDTINNVRQAGIKVCSGGILSLGESRQDRINLLIQLASLDPQPESVPINNLVPIEGTPLANNKLIDNFEFIRTIAVARILLPKTVIRLAAGREAMSEEMQALCFMAGANSIFYGDKLLTEPNRQEHQDLHLFEKLGIKPMAPVKYPESSTINVAETTAKTETIDVCIN